MHRRHRNPFPTARLAITGIAAAAFLAVTTPARAADTDYKGWFAALDIAQTQPESLDQHFANHVVSAAPNSTTERLVMDNGSKATWRAAVGYGFGKDKGSLKVSYWSFDNDDKQEKSGLLGAVYPTVVGYTVNGTQYLGYTTNTLFPIQFAATSKVKAKTYDIDYVRPMVSGEKTTIKWLAGLRVASYEENQGFNGFETASPTSTYIQNKHFKSNGIGPRLGVAAVFGFTKHFSVQGGMAISFLQADTKGDFTAIRRAGPNVDTGSTKDDRIRGEIRDYDIRAVWGGYGHLDYYLGYAASEWSGMVANALPPADCCTDGAANRGRDNIAFNSLHGGVIWRFSKK